MRFTILFSCILMFALQATDALSQNFRQQRMELQQQQEQTRDNIQNLRQQLQSYRQEISRTADRYEEAYARYENLQREISVRDALVSNLQEERAQINSELQVTRDNIDVLRDDLETLIRNYKETLRYIYKHGRTPELAMLLTAGSVNQMLRRSYYLSRFEDHRQKQAENIELAQKELEEQEQDLVALQRRNEANLEETREEQRTLTSRMEEQEQLIAVLQRDQESYQKRLEQTVSEVEELENILVSIIEEEERIRKAEEERLRQLEEERQRRMAAAENIRNPGDRARSVPSASRAAGIPSEDDMEVIAQSFTRQKGQLPFPVESGAISSRFGVRTNPLYGTKVPNPGVEIATASRSEVRAVHDGYVSNIRPIPGYGDCVFVHHGDYITVYGNLSDINVTPRQTIRAGDVVGLSGDENSIKGQSLFFMIWQGTSSVDPEVWLAGK